MKQLFKEDFFFSNRKKLYDQANSDLIIVTANSRVLKSADLSYDFKQDSNFWYLTGISEPDFILVISKKEIFLIKPKLTLYQEIFESIPNDKELSLKSGITLILDNKEGLKKLKNEVAISSSVAIILEKKSYLYTTLIVASNNKRLKNYISRINPKIEIRDLIAHLSQLRMIKSKQEIKTIARAVQITKNSLKELIDNELSKLNSTSQIDAWLEYSFRIGGATSHAFNSIIAQGKKACIIHYPFKDQALNNKDMLLLDCGAEYSNYASDISRTISLSKMNSRQSEVYNAVKSVQSKAFDLIRPGVYLKNLEIEVANLIGKELIKLNLINSLQQSEIRKYYPHAFSHSLGLDTHDLADYSLPLQENMVITVEPGIYIPSQGIAVRIEDDVLIKKDGIKVL